jgi:hypothetical protein
VDVQLEDWLRPAHHRPARGSCGRLRNLYLRLLYGIEDLNTNRNMPTMPIVPMLLWLFDLLLVNWQRIGH